MFQRSQKIIVYPSPLEGRGIMAIESIEPGELIEICPVIVIPHKDVEAIHKTILHDYYFLWGEQEELAAIALGYGSLYNHALLPNANYHMDFDTETIEIIAIHQIEAGEEVTINYNGEPGKFGELWFDERDA